MTVYLGTSLRVQDQHNDTNRDCGDRGMTAAAAAADDDEDDNVNDGCTCYSVLFFVMDFQSSLCSTSDVERRRRLVLLSL